MIAAEVKIATGDNQLPPHPRLQLWGYQSGETAGAVGNYTLRHGSASTSPALTPRIYHAANSVSPIVMFPAPIPCPNGILVNRGAGTISVVLYVEYE